MTPKNDDIFSLRELAIERNAARDTLKHNFVETKERVKPKNLMQEATDNALDKVQDAGRTAVDAVKSNPGITASVIAAAALVTLRKPLTRLISSGKSTSSPDPEE